MTRMVVFSADNGYIEQLTTAIKSLIYYNHDLTIGVFNADIPQEWFLKLNNDYRAVGVQIKNLKLAPEVLAGKPVSRTHIDPMTYARLLIPERLTAARVLYLDSDLVVNGPLDELFNLDLAGNLIGAVTDYAVPESFNAGVLLIDNAKLRQIDGLTARWLAEADQGLANDDQTILNHYFGDHYFRLPDTYNLCLGTYATASYYQKPLFPQIKERFRRAQPYRILHYDTVLKPWHEVSTGILRQRWWQYNALTPGAVVDHAPLPNFWEQKRGNLWISTYTQDLPEIKTLVQALPDCCFYITAPTNMGTILLDMMRYPNVRLYPAAINENIDEIITKLDAYLDINLGPKDQKALERVRQAGIPILRLDDGGAPALIAKIRALL
ncbi:glycosyltransferase family 8 protein [Limosilactobacillus kribbianus]|uniref:glycosyltransferase family 8 protein n=1 Tax=Limosilactobacillus kribbianus TaxID=2982695 RepID=UPI0022653695|nr:glycosyltransferase [Limosilactobacillus kribbianus]